MGFFFLLGLLSTALTTGVSAQEPASRPASLATATLTVLYTNDTHSHLQPFDLPKVGKNIGGIARRYEYIKAVRAKQSACLLLDGGDVFQGTPFFSFFKGEVDVKAFTLCGYDATTLGNHELDEGLANLKQQYKLADFPLLCANVVHADSRELVFPAFRILERAGRQIAVIGCIGSEAWNVISLDKRRGLEFLDPLVTLPPLVERLRATSDLVILLSHSGYEGDVQLAGAVPGIDLIIGGHTNTYVEHPIVVKTVPRLVANRTDNGLGGTMVVQAFKWGYYVGRLDFDLGTDSRILSYRAELHQVDASTTVPLDSPVQRLVSAYEARISLLTDQVIGTCAEDMFYPEEEKHGHDLPLGTFVSESLMEFLQGDLAIINSGAIRDVLFAGPVTIGRIYSVLPFDNSVVSLVMTGEQIRAMLQFICDRFGTITGYQYGGLTFTLDLTRREVREIKVQGKPLDLAREYKVITISYLTDGNQNGHDLFRGARDQVDAGYLMRDAVIARFKKLGRVVSPGGGRMTLIPPFVPPSGLVPGAQQSGPPATAAPLLGHGPGRPASPSQAGGPTGAPPVGSDSGFPSPAETSQGGAINP